MFSLTTIHSLAYESSARSPEKLRGQDEVPNDHMTSNTRVNPKIR
jgi:hypothetical protein